jgi:4-amino-4-deoxy-L-arabinose transferase-like glycosyltransferase
MTSAYFANKLNILFIIIVTLVWAFLYLPNIRTSPAWYGDEGLALTAGLNLAHGIPVHGSFWNTFWNPYAPYQPFYEFCIGWAARLTGGDILGARLVNSFFALITALIITFYGRRVLGFIFSLCAALIFLTFEQSVIHFRWIFTHNLIALGYALAFIGLSGNIKTKSNIIAGIGLGISALALPLSIYGLIAAALLRIRHPRSWLPVCGPYVFVTFSSLALGFGLYPKQGFIWSDLVETFRFYVEASRENGGGFKFFENISRFFLQDAFHAFGFLMFLICLRGKAFAIGFGGLLISFLLLQNRQNLTVFYYQAVILTPLLAMAYGYGLRKIFLMVRRAGFQSKIFLRVSMSIPFVIAGFSFFTILPSSLKGTLKTRIDFWTTQSNQEVESAADWINSRTTPEDLVICHQNIAWLLHARTADYLQAATWQGLSTWPFKRPLRKDQFRFEPKLDAAKFAVIADIDQRWTINQPSIPNLIQIFESEKWLLVWSGANYKVLKNPRFVSSQNSTD